MNWLNPLKWFPWTQEGRATAMYISFCWAMPVLTLVTYWAMGEIEHFPEAAAEQRLSRFADIADRLMWALIIGMVIYACFISIRAFKVNLKTGDMDVNSNAAQGAQTVADAAQDKADEVKETTQ